MNKIKFINSRMDAQWAFKLTDGRMIEVLKMDGKFAISFDTPFNLATGEIFDKKDGKNHEYALTLNHLKMNGLGEVVCCYDEYDVDLGDVTTLTERMVNKICKEFAEHGFNVTPQAIWNNYGCWRGSLKSGYRDDANGYHLFTPCGGNPLSFRATNLIDGLDWQTTYIY